jgi:acetyltransferase
MALVRLSQLLSDIDEVVDIDLDPLHVETDGVLALQARAWIEGRARRVGPQRFAISPYPKELERQIKWGREKLLIRPIRPEDERLLGKLLESLTPEDSRMRFFVMVRGQTHLQLARFSQIDYDREMSLVVIRRPGKPDEQVLAEARLSADADNQQADFAIVVSSLCSGKGLGRMLLKQLIDYAQARGIARLHGETLIENKRMQHLAVSLGFELERSADPATINLYLTLSGIAKQA